MCVRVPPGGPLVLRGWETASPFWAPCIAELTSPLSTRSQPGSRRPPSIRHSPVMVASAGWLGSSPEIGAQNYFTAAGGALPPHPITSQPPEDGTLPHVLPLPEDVSATCAASNRGRHCDHCTASKRGWHSRMCCL